MYLGAVRVRLTRMAFRLVSCWFRGKPSMWAPQTATEIRSSGVLGAARVPGVAAPPGVVDGDAAWETEEDPGPLRAVGDAGPKLTPTAAPDDGRGGMATDKAPSGTSAARWRRSARASSPASAPARPTSVTPKGNPSSRKPAGHGNCGEIEQIDEVGVVTEVGVEADGFGLHRVDAIDCSRRGCDQHIHRRPGALSGAPQLHQAVLRAKGVRRRRIAAARDDLSRHWVQGIRVVLEEVADGAVALGDPRPLVQKSRGG